MFLDRRSAQAEYFDAGPPAAEVAAYYRELWRVNRLCSFARPFAVSLPRLLGPAACRRLHLLDVGAGDGRLGAVLFAWAHRRNWKWHFTNLDQTPAAPAAPENSRHVVGSALDLPFPDASFDVVIASQMTHHLATDAEIIRHFQEAGRVARRVVLIADLHRNLGLYAMLWMLLKLLPVSPQVRQDGLISVQRGFRIPEWRHLAARAGMPGARVWLYFGSRIVLEWHKHSWPDN